MRRLADGLERRLDEVARLESRDTGKPLALTRDLEIPRAISNLRFFADAATQFSSESHHGEAGLNVTLLKRPTLLARQNLHSRHREHGGECASATKDARWCRAGSVRIRLCDARMNL